MDDTILTAARKVGTDESADAICKVLPILALVCPSLTEQDGGENALRTKCSLPQRKQKSERKSSVLKTE